MYELRKFYINGEWVEPARPQDFAVINPATEESVGTISLGGPEDVNRAVAAAQAAFPAFAASDKRERVALIGRIIEAYQDHYEDVARAISDEMGAPLAWARKSQTFLGVGHLQTVRDVMEHYAFVEDRGGMRLIKEPIGVCGFITPWNWPITQIACKLAPALAAGCTMVLKPSEIAPLSAMVFTSVLDEAGVPAGVFNLVNGDGPTVGQAIARHPDVDMVSFTGSTRGGVAVAKAAADSVKRVHQELGGKSANIILDGDILERAVEDGVDQCFSNTGQSCNAPTRMLVPAALHAQAVEIARATAARAVPGDPKAEATTMGPVVSQLQFDKIQRLIEAGIEEGAELVCGGPGRPEGLERGYFVQPTIFANVNNDMTIAREEIFGPVLCIMPYEDEDDALRIANDTPYGLAAYVSATDIETARRMAANLRAGMVHVNGASMELNAPFGGFKQSGNGREWGEFGLEEFLEIKAVLGYAA
jgi:aldehyde dehydrogenase (NAD+)